MIRSFIHRHLRFAERFFQTDLVYLVKHGSWLFVNTALTAVIGLVTSYLYANLLSPDQYGQYRYIFSIFTALNAFSLTGINVAVTQAVAKGKEGALLQSIPLQLKWNVVFCVAFIAIGGYYLAQGNYVFALSLLTLSLLAPIANIANTYGGFLQGKKEFKAFSIISLLTSVAIFGSVAATLFLHANVVLLVIANIGTTALVQVLAFFWTLRKYQPNKQLDDGLGQFSTGLSILTAISTIVTQFDTFLMFNLLGAASVSILSFATIVPDQLKGFVKILSQLALPKFAVNETPESRRQALKNSFKLAGLMLLAAIAYILIAPFVFRWLFPAYQASVFYTRVYALTMVFSVYQIPISLLFAHKHQSRIARFTIFSCITVIVSSSVFIPIFGLAGAIIAKVVAQGMNLAISSYYVWIKPQTPEPQSSQALSKKS